MKTTLFMLMSVDGKITTGSVDEMDFDKDLPNITGVAEGLGQYYDLEQKTDLFSFNTGRVMAKVGWNNEKEIINETPVSFVIVDSKPHLTLLGISNLIRNCKNLIVVTTNENHPAFFINNSKLRIIKYEQQIDFVDLFNQLELIGVGNMTIQSGGNMNGILLRAGLIDELLLVVAPILVGGSQTQSLIGGNSLTNKNELTDLRTLKLLESTPLKDNYLLLRYSVKNSD